MALNPGVHCAANVRESCLDAAPVSRLLKGGSARIGIKPDVRSVDFFRSLAMGWDEGIVVRARPMGQLGNSTDMNRYCGFHVGFPVFLFVFQHLKNSTGPLVSCGVGIVSSSRSS